MSPSLFVDATLIFRKMHGNIPDIMQNRIYESLKLLTQLSVKTDMQRLLAGHDGRKQGHIVSISTPAGFSGSVRLTDYCASKLAAVGFEESLRFELRSEGYNGIKSSVICPYMVNTEMFPGVKLSGEKYGELRNRLATVPYRKMLDKEEDRIRLALGYKVDKRLTDAQKCFLKVFDYNARTGKKIRASVLLKAFCTYGFSLDDSTWNHWDSDRWKSATILAWCMELFQAYLVVLDDIMDQSALRRGEPCWYTKSDVGLRAINDALFLLCSVYKILEKYFAGSKCYMNILHEFLQINHDTVYGQGLDMMFQPKPWKTRHDMFTLQTFQTLTEYKTAYYSFCLPAHLAMHLAGECSAGEFEYTREICLKLGLYYGIQGDYLDCFEKPEVTGKIGNDITEGKCTWFSVKFLQVASEPMKKQFFENYGVDDKDAVANVLELYRKTNLFEIFEETMSNCSAEIIILIESRNDVKRALFYDLYAQIQKRNFTVKS